MSRFPAPGRRSRPTTSCSAKAGASRRGSSQWIEKGARLSPMPDAFDHCQDLVRSGDKNRFLATLFAPQKYRRALFALYAFTREVARPRERAREPMPGEIRLQWWRDLLGGAG